jgi:predicted polyphosphate/ATP-dependent NAD kinase
MAAAAAMRAAGVELILFAGGDGTARDIAAIVGTDIPLIGVPSGVKMHSAVFAATPESAGLLARDVLRAAPGAIPAREAEILDVDETARRAGVPRARLYGLALVPAPRRPMPHAKLSGSAPGAALRAACVDVARGLRPDRLYLIGPGTTTRLVMRALGLPDTLLGIDAVRDGQLIGADLTRADIARMAADGPLGVIVGVIGGQGVLFGRGNQQIAPDILRRAGRDGIIVLADADKIAALDGGALFVDTGDPDLDAAWRGYIRVRTAPDRSLLCRVLS